MNLHYFFFILLFFLNSAFAQNSDGDQFFVLEGIADNSSTNNKLFLSYLDYQNHQILDSTIIINGKFKFKGRINEPEIAFLSINKNFRLDGKSSIKFYLSPNVVDIKTDFYNLSVSEFKGSKTQIEFLKLQEMKASIFLKQDSLYSLRASSLELVNETENSEQKKNIEVKIAEIDNSIDKTTDEEIAKEFDYIKTNPYSYVNTGLLVSRLRSRKSSKYFSEIQNLYSLLPSKLKNSMGGTLLKEKLEKYLENSVGQKIKDYTLIDINKRQFKLSEARNGKYILLDFWASWCGPCRADTPYLIELYNKYNNKGFDIIGLSKDEDRKLWIDAIKKDHANWKHILLNENDDTILETFFITAIPVKILINPEGIIIGRWRGGGKENQNDIIDKVTNIFANN